MSCQSKYPIIEYLEGKLSGEELEVVETHLKQCDQCRASLKVYTDYFKIIEQQKKVAVKPFLMTRIKARIESKAQTNRLVWGYLRPALASFIIIIALYSGFLFGTKYTDYRVSSSSADSTLFWNDLSQESFETTLVYEQTN